MYTCSFASVEWKSAMFYMLNKSRARAAASLFMVEMSAGLLLAMAFVISMLIDLSAQKFSFPAKALTLSFLILFSIMAATAVTGTNFLAAPPMPGKACRCDPDDARCARSCYRPRLCLW